MIKVTRTYLLIVFLFSLLNKGYSQTDSTQDFTIQFGLDFKSLYTEKYSFEEFRTQFPQSIEATKDFSSYHFDSSFVHYGIAPVCLRLDYGWKANLGKHKLVKNVMYRFMIELNRCEMYYQNFLKEESNGDYMVFDTVHRDYYAFEWNQRSLSFVFGLQFNSRFFFKRKRDRVWLGLYILNGLSSGNIRKFHSYGQSPGVFTGNVNGVDQFEYFGSPYSYYQEIDNIDIGKFYLVGLQVPVGYEHICGKYRNFGLGFQILFGSGILISNGPKIPLGLGGLMYNLRFII